jgi:hypothetical protein
MRLLDALSGRTGTNPPTVEQRFGMDEYVQMLFDGNRYIVGPSGSRADEVSADLTGRVSRIHERHGVVAAAVAARALLLSQVRFRWRRVDGSLYGDRSLLPLERPGSMTRPEMLTRAEIDVSYGGTSFIVLRGGELFRLNPDKTQFVLASDSDPTWSGDTLIAPFDTRVVGLLFNAVKNGTSGPTEAFGPGEFAVWAPEPDPIYPWRGTSWVSSVMREILIDGQVTEHEGKFFEKATTPGLVFMMDPSRTPDEIKAYSDIVNSKFAGVANSYKNMFLGGATDVKVVGSKLVDLGLSELQGTFENRVAVRSRIPAVVLGTKESLSGSSLNAGNYSAARRMLADGWFSPTVDNLCAALESIVPPPGDGTELGHDPSRVLFMQEDQKDAADITQTNSVAMRQLVEAGFDPITVVEAVTTGDMTKLKHTGNVSVQLQPPGSQMQANSADIVAELRHQPPAPQALTVNVDARQEPGTFTVEPAVVNVEPPVVNIENRMDAAPVPTVTVNVEPTPVTVENRVDVSPTPVTIDSAPIAVNVPAQPAPDVVVNVESQRTKHRVKRDSNGNITEVIEEPV